MIWRGTRAEQADFRPDQMGALYDVTDEGVLEQWTGTIWESVGGGGASGNLDGGAPDSVYGGIDSIDAGTP